LTGYSGGTSIVVAMDFALLPKRILVVDDEEVIRDVIASKIQKSLGYDVIQASNGIEALKAVEDLMPDLIITDIKMPAMSGIELLGEIRRRRIGSPVIILTGYGTMEDAISAIRLGAKSFIKKPFDINQVILLIENIFAVHQETADVHEIVPFIRSQSFTIRIPNNYIYLSKVINYIFLTARDCWEMDPAELNDVKVALYEALLNAFEHGNLQVDKASKERCLVLGHSVYRKYLLERMATEENKAKSITVFSAIDPIRLEISVLDEGPGFNHGSVNEDLDPESFMRMYGRGLFLIKNLMDEVSFNDRGNMLRFLKYRPRMQDSPLFDESELSTGSA
jgi:DNA-binding response OmpR family regulator